MKLDTDGSQKERRGGAAAEPIPLMRSVAIVVAQELSERVLQAGATGEVRPTEAPAPGPLRDGPLHPLDDPVGPGMPRLGAGVPNPEPPTGFIEGPLEPGAPAGQPPPQRPTRDAVQGRQGVA